MKYSRSMTIAGIKAYIVRSHYLASGNGNEFMSGVLAIASDMANNSERKRFIQREIELRSAQLN